ncbi:MAG: type 4a pilus biogenesis protein PilO [Candidatus Omnitrophota bacterium]
MNPKNSILKNQKLIIILVIAAVIIVIDVTFALRPLFTGLIKVLPNLNAKASRLKIIDTDVKNIPEYEKELFVLHEKLSGYKRTFATKEEISPLLKNLSDTAKEFGVKIISVNPVQNVDESETKASGAYSKFPIFLSAVSGYHAFGLFLNKLENSDTFMRISDLKIEGNLLGIGEHKFSVTIVTYILSPAVTIEEAEDAAVEKKKESANKQLKGKKKNKTKDI